MYLIDQLTVVIVTYKTNKQILDQCIKSILGKAKILIVENSYNKELKLSYEKNFPNLEVFLTGSNLGYGGGNNKGLSLVKTKYALISNPDVIYEEDFFNNLKTYIDEKTDFNIIGPLYRSNDYASHGYFDDLKNNKYQIDGLENESLIKTHWIVGCTMFINLEKFENKKLFDENFFLFFEEFDLCKRTLINGNLIYSSNKLLVKHLGFKGSFASDAKYEIDALKLKNWHYMWSQFYFNKKYEGIFISYIKGLASLLKNSIKILFNVITNNKLETIKYKFRFSGLLSSMLTKKSSFRINF